MNHLLKAVEILKERYKGEIYDSCWFDPNDEDSELYPNNDWSYNLTQWTIKIDTDDGINYNVVAYPVKDNQTQWDSMQFVRLPSYPVEFELVS